MNLKKQLGQRIKTLRIKNKLTQEKLAELANIDTKHQSSIETGRYYPSCKLIEKYAEIFSTSPAVILKLDIIDSKEEMIEKIIKILNKSSLDEVKKIYRMLCG